VVPDRSSRRWLAGLGNRAALEDRRRYAVFRNSPQHSAHRHSDNRLFMNEHDSAESRARVLSAAYVPLRLSSSLPPRSDDAESQRSRIKL